MHAELIFINILLGGHTWQSKHRLRSGVSDTRINETEFPTCFILKKKQDHSTMRGFQQLYDRIQLNGPPRIQSPTQNGAGPDRTRGSPRVPTRHIVVKSAPRRHSGFPSFNSTPNTNTSHPGIRRVWCFRCHSWAIQRGPARGDNVVAGRYWCRPSSMTCVSCVTERWARLRTSDSTLDGHAMCRPRHSRCVCVTWLTVSVLTTDTDRLARYDKQWAWLRTSGAPSRSVVTWSHLVWSVRRC